MQRHTGGNAGSESVHLNLDKKGTKVQSPALIVPGREFSRRDALINLQERRYDRCFAGSRKHRFDFDRDGRDGDAVIPTRLGGIALIR